MSSLVGTGHGLARWLVALLLAFVVGALADRAGLSVPVRAVTLAPIAVFLVRSPALRSLAPPWMLVASAVLAPLVGALLADVDRRHAARGIAPVLLAVTAVGVYETVPDPDMALVLLPTTMLFALGAWPAPRGRLGGGASAVLGLVFAVVITVGAVGRGSGFVGSLGTFGLFFVEPGARFWTGSSAIDRLPRRPRSTFHAALAHLALVVFASRVAGRLASTEIAAALVVIAYAIGAVALVRFTRGGAK